MRIAGRRGKRLMRTGRRRAALCALALALNALIAPGAIRAEQSGRVLVVAAPFPTIADSLTSEALRAFWNGDAAALRDLSNNQRPPTLFISPATLADLRLLWGEPSRTAALQVVPEDQLLDTTWKAHPSAFAILPFDQLEARWKLLHVDGVNLFERETDLSRYPLVVPGKPNNRDLSRMTIVAMTGVTAMVRGTAVMMERKGILYPAAAIRDWLRGADITHISNEVSFWENCPRPSFNSGVVMCSDPRYIALLEDVGTDVVELTGNHLWDYGWRHLNTTLDMYEARGWQYFGGGRTITTALEPARFTHNGNRIAFVGCNWFGSNWATETRPGSARCGSRSPRELDLIQGAIRRAREEGYHVIVGIQYLELYSYQASPQQVRDFNALLDAGAVIVNGSQGHHAQGFSVNEKGFAHYGVGNLFFGDQAGVGVKQTFVDRHVFYDGRYLGADLRAAFIVDNSQPVPMKPAERAALLRRLFAVSHFW